MPIYDFKCEKCNYKLKKNLSISSFLNIKNSMVCDKCKEVMLQNILRVSGIIDRKAEELGVIAKEEAAIIVAKVRAGDEKTIREIYGEDKNQLKQR